uniref:DUF229 domain-containing protein n=2 Tax=Strongyloides stercoralis TaxID=6248 RepID=A0A0K0EGZ4_STRER
MFHCLKYFKKKSKLFLLCFLFMVFWLIILYLIIPKNFYQINKTILHNENIIEKCYIPQFDIWDNSTINYIHKTYTIKKCKKKYKNIYYTLNNGLLEINSELFKKINCSYACIYPYGDSSIKKGLYFEIKKPVILDCDTFYIYCKNNSNNIIFEDINFHIRKINISKEESPNFIKKNYFLPKHRKKYNLFIYVIDSLSFYQAKRGLIKTRKLFKDKYKSIEFSFLNRVADNSRPNAYAFLMNKNSENVTDIFNNNLTIINDWGKDDPCYSILDNTTYILELYKKLGYTTLNAEDYWYGGIFNWFNCKGFQNQQADHTLRTFQLAKKVISHKLFDRIKEERCFIKGLHMLEYLKDFLERYKDEPHASLIWGTDIMHHDINGILEVDNLLETFFDKNINLFDDSFIFIMGDHGFRLGEYQKTIIGEYEGNNPYLMISVPKELRNNIKLIKNLKDNSKKHISHLDIYATLLDILTESSKNNFKTFEKFNLSLTVNFKVKGQSILRELPNKNRSCWELNVPVEFCLCQVNFTKSFLLSKEVKDNLKKAFVNEINKKIDDNNLNKLCSKRYINNDQIFSINTFNYNNEILAYKVKGNVLPGNGYFSGIFSKNYKLINGELLRLNSYSHESEKCLYEQRNSKYCYCK